MSQIISPQIESLVETNGQLFAFFTQSEWSRRIGEPGISDFVVGNPHEMPIPGFAAALQNRSVPQDAHWFAYKQSEPGAQETVAASLQQRFGIPFEPDDICMTNGGAAAIAVALRAIVSPGDEEIQAVITYFKSLWSDKHRRNQYQESQDQPFPTPEVGGGS